MLSKLRQPNHRPTSLPRRPHQKPTARHQRYPRHTYWLGMDNPKLVAEDILTLSDTFPTEMKGNWSIDKVTARGDSKAWYMCTVVASEVV